METSLLWWSSAAIRLRLAQRSLPARRRSASTLPPSIRMSEPNACAINVAQTGLIVKVRIGRKGVQFGQTGAQSLGVDEVADADMTRAA
jgi:hypothetical protein